jgi:hypothetical protein
MKKFLAPVFAFCAVLFLFGIESPLALAQENQGMVRGVDNPKLINESTSYDGSFRESVLTIVNFFLYFVGLLSVVMFIYGGFIFITTGSEDGSEKGKKILLYAGIGIIVILVSYAAVNTILGSGNVNSGGEL